jgi:hypothetical protein
MSTEPSESGLPSAFNWRASTTNADYIRVSAAQNVPWLLILSQGTIHVGDVGCGKFGCFGRVMTATWYN